MTKLMIVRDSDMKKEYSHNLLDKYKDDMEDEWSRMIFPEKR